MFTDHRFAATMRAEQQRADGALGRADILSAGTLVTSPKGHGTEYGLQIPTLASAGDAQAFVDARIAEGSDYIKIVYDDGAAYGDANPDHRPHRAWRGDRRRKETGQARGGPRRLQPGRERGHRRRSERARAHLRGRAGGRGVRDSRRGRAGVRDAHSVGHREHDRRRQRCLAPQGCAPRAVHHRCGANVARGTLPEPPRVEAEPGVRPRRHQAALRRGRSDPGRHRRAEPRNLARIESSPRARAAGPGGALPRSRARGGDVRARAHLQPARQGAHRARASRRPRAGERRPQPRHHRHARHRLDLEARRSPGKSKSSGRDRALRLRRPRPGSSATSMPRPTFAPSSAADGSHRPTA